MAISKIKSDSIDSIAATKLTGTVDNARITLDAAEIPNLDAAKITTGDIALARLGNAPATDTSKIENFHVWRKYKTSLFYASNWHNHLLFHLQNHLRLALFHTAVRTHIRHTKIKAK